jgi:hypothetical protein
MEFLHEFDIHNHPAKAGSLGTYRLSIRAGSVIEAEGGGRACTAEKVDEKQRITANIIFIREFIFFDTCLGCTGLGLACYETDAIPFWKAEMLVYITTIYCCTCTANHR